MAVTVRINALELDVLWEAGHAGEPPYPLVIRSHGATMDERATLRRQAHEGLRDRGLLDRTGRLAPRVEGWLDALARPRQSIDSVYLPELSARPVRALAARGAGAAVLAIQDDDGLTLRHLDPGGLVSAIVDLLPPERRGTQPSISLPADEFALVSAGAPAGTPA
ncbi:MAG TPA: ESX secretion-associated protein EspG, partial [Actinophytocola sp.]|uniref:ESX secretion-associated protein EspG n=1 Tax=Actinophytocola sp. TaxID=1872138 RepID=UPI002DDD3CF9